MTVRSCTTTQSTSGAAPRPTACKAGCTAWPPPAAHSARSQTAAKCAAMTSRSPPRAARRRQPAPRRCTNSSSPSPPGASPSHPGPALGTLPASAVSWRMQRQPIAAAADLDQRYARRGDATTQPAAALPVPATPATAACASAPAFHPSSIQHPFGQLGKPPAFDADVLGVR